MQKQRVLGFVGRNLIPFFFNEKLDKLAPYIVTSIWPRTLIQSQNPTFPFSSPNNTSFSTAASIAPVGASSIIPVSRDGNYDDKAVDHACPGCGVILQDVDPKQLGFFTRPSVKVPNFRGKDGLDSVSLDTQFTHSLKIGVHAPDEETMSQQAVDRPKPPVVCARCHSLRHYGKVKEMAAENLLPEFDFFHTVGRRLVSASGARTVVLLVVDAADFDGSFPTRVAKMVSAAIEEHATNWKEGKPGNVAQLVLVVTKLDLLPTEMSPTRFEHWLRQRAKEGGATAIKKLHFVSATRNWGIKDLVDDVMILVGSRGNVWAVGTQNAGKSTLINAMAKCGRNSTSYLTSAPVPGTTLGIVRVEGVLPGNVKFFDTPGLLNSRQITTRLTREEQKVVHMGKELKPRTYRIKEGHSIHIGGLMRLDSESLSVDSIYVTVWASLSVPLHMGKTENAIKLKEEHFGCQLQPPIGEGRVKELGTWVRHEFHVSGQCWDSSSMDIAAGGIGWFAVGLKGEATLAVWTYEGTDVVLRNSLIPHKAKTFEVPGFSVSKIVSSADKASNKFKPMEKKTQSVDYDTALSA